MTEVVKLQFGDSVDEIKIERLVDSLFEGCDMDNLMELYNTFVEGATSDKKSTSIMSRIMMEKFEERFAAMAN